MQRMDVKEIEEQPAYNDWTGNNDLALLKLQKALDFCGQPHIRPVCLPADSSQNLESVEAKLTGWGRTTVTVMGNQLCNKDYSATGHFITSNMLCATVEGGRKASCQVSRHPRD